MYLELKHRIPVIAARTHIGREELQRAQDTVGLSNERIARLIPVSEKTWRRWKEAGEVPTAVLPQVAKVLRLELVAPPQATVEMPEGFSLREEAAAGIAQLLDGQAETLAVLARIEGKLDELSARRPVRRAPRKSAR